MKNGIYAFPIVTKCLKVNGELINRRKKWQPTRFLAWKILWTEEPGSPWGRKESETTE